MAGAPTVYPVFNNKFKVGIAVSYTHLTLPTNSRV